MFKFVRMFAVVVVSLLVSGSAYAQDSAPKSVAVTIYSNATNAYGYNNYGYYDPYYGGGYGYGNTYGSGYSIVKEVRAITLAAGSNEIRFSDVPQQIDATTVNFKSLLDPENTFVLEQNFEYDLVSADKVLSRYIDEPVALHDKTNGVLQGDLLSYDLAQVVLDTADPAGPIQIINRGELAERITFAELPGGLITKPTLMWKVDAKKSGNHDVEVTYQTNGMGWSADYNLLLDKDDMTADLSAWVTITNGSGGTFNDATLKLVAGDVQRVSTMGAGYGMGGGGYAYDGVSADQGFSEQSFFEYHLYTLGRTTTLKQNSTKQLELFTPAVGLPVTKTYTYRGNANPYYDYGYPYQDQYYGTPNTKVDVVILFDNAKAKGLGIPLPAGRVRVYKADPSDGSVEFVGEDQIDHTPKEETVKIKTGSAFDVVSEWKVADFKVDYDQMWMEESLEVTLRNHKTEDITVSVEESLYRWTNWAIIKKSHEFTKRDARNVGFDVTVPKEGETKVTYTVRYTW